MARPTLPPGPSGTLLSGNLPALRRDWLGGLTRFAREYGDFVPLRLGPRRAFLLSHPSLVEEVLVTNSANFVKAPALRNSRRLLGNGLILSEGELWRRQRRLVQPAFQRQSLHGYAHVMSTCIEEFLPGWADGDVRDVHAEMMRLTLRIAAQTLFGADISDQSDVFSKALAIALRRFDERFSSWMYLLPDNLPTPRNLSYLRATGRLDQIVGAIIRARRDSAGEQRDLLGALLTAQEENGSRMSDRQVRDEVMTLLLAGHETTALALTWTLVLLSSAADAEQQLGAELHDVLDARLPTAEDIPNLRWTAHVLAESMRLYPPAWTQAREALSACVIGGYHIPKGATLLMSQWVIQRDPRWFEQPERFLPERWESGQSRSLPRLAYFPFGAGPRACVGAGFATQEAILVLASILQRFRLRLISEAPVVPHASVTLRPRDPVHMRIERR